MIIPLAVMGFLAFLVCVLTPVVLCIKRRQWTAKRKKAVFSLVAAFFTFPVLVPAGFIAALPAPNIVFLLFAIFTSLLPEAPEWYFKTSVFCIISYSVTAAIFALISQMIFFERKQV